MAPGVTEFKPAIRMLDFRLPRRAPDEPTHGRRWSNLYRPFKGRENYHDHRPYGHSASVPKPLPPSSTQSRDGGNAPLLVPERHRAV